MGKHKLISTKRVLGGGRMRNFSVGIIGSCSLFLNGCANHLPPLSVTGDSSPPTVTDVTDKVACELYGIVSAVKTDTNDNGPPTYTLAPPSDIPVKLEKFVGNDETKKALVENLIKYNFVASVSLTLEVTDSEGFNPSLSFITPFNRMKINTSSFTMGLGGQFSGVQDRKYTTSYNIDLAKLKKPEDCQDHHDAGLQALGVEDGLKGDLGLADILFDGLKTLYETSGANFYSQTSGPFRPTVLQRVDLKSEKIQQPGLSDHESRLGITEFQGNISFAPLSTYGLLGHTVTLSGLVTFDGEGRKGRCLANLTGYTLSDLGAEGATQPPPTYIEFIATGQMTFIPSGDQNQDNDLATTCESGDQAFVKGVVDGSYMTNPDERYLVVDFYSDSSRNKKFLPASSPSGTPLFTDAVAEVDLSPTTPEKIKDVKRAEAALTPIVSAPKFSGLTQSLTSFLQGNYSSIPVMSASPGSSGAPPQAQTNPGSSPSPSGASGSSGGVFGSSGTSFGSTVDFTVVYGLNGGPTWSLTHFKGPAGSSSLFSAGRTVIDTLNISFVPACQDAQSVPPEVKSYWDSIGPCNATSFANAAALGQYINSNPSAP